MNNSSKLEYLDGLRGLMAINVLLCHFSMIFYPHMIQPGFVVDKHPALSIFGSSPLSVLLNGNIAVQYFFILTGFLVGRSSFLSSSKSFSVVLSKCIKRYFRLLPVVAAAVIFAFISMKLGIMNHSSALHLIPNPDFFLGIWNFTPDLRNLFEDIFVRSFISNSAYVPIFWTIRYEFWGYILSILIAFVLKNMPWRKPLYLVFLAIVALFFDENYFPFIYGIFIADLVYNQNEDKFAPFFSLFVKKPWFIILCFAGGTYFASCPLNFTGIHTFWARFSFISTSTLRAVGMALVFYALLHSALFQKLLSIRPVAFLGSISFEVYAFHLPLISILQMWIFKILHGNLSYDFAALMSFALYLCAVFAFSYLMHCLLKKAPSLNIRSLLNK